MQLKAFSPLKNKTLHQSSPSTPNCTILISYSNNTNQVLLPNRYTSQLNYKENMNPPEKKSTHKAKFKPRKINTQNKFDDYESFKQKPSARFNNTKYANPFGSHRNSKTVFGNLYVNNGIPCHLSHSTVALNLVWDEDIEKIDYNKILPICFEGIIETEHPFKFAARQCSKEMILAKNAYGKVVPLLPKLFWSIKAALKIQGDNELFEYTCDIINILTNLVKEKILGVIGIILQDLNKCIFRKNQRENVFNLLRNIELTCGKEAGKIIQDKIPSYFVSI